MNLIYEYMTMYRKYRKPSFIEPCFKSPFLKLRLSDALLFY
jgi:hypothetical protein